MEALRTWGISLCAAAAVCMAVEMLAPKTPLQKMLKLVVGVFFLSAVFSPILLQLNLGDMEARFLDFEATSLQAEETAASMGSQLTLTMAEEELTRVVERGLESAGFAGGRGEISLIINENNEIMIEHARITLPQEYAGEEGRVRAVLEEKIGSGYQLEFI